MVSSDVFERARESVGDLTGSLGDLGGSVWDSLVQSVHEPLYQVLSESVLEIMRASTWYKALDDELRRSRFNWGRGLWVLANESVCAYGAAHSMAYYRFFDEHLKPN